jgi:class 3 adenylate cyclase
VPPDFAQATVMFITLLGLAELVDEAHPVDEATIVFSFSNLIALINAEVEARGGVMRKVTYHLTGPDIMILFGVPNSHTDDSVRAVYAALAIREIVSNLEIPPIGGHRPMVKCQIGIAQGPVFVAEFGDPRGRREFNMLGDTVNTAARLMTSALENQVLMTTAVHDAIAGQFETESLGEFSLKGKAVSVPVYALKSARSLD